MRRRANTDRVGQVVIVCIGAAAVKGLCGWVSRDMYLFALGQEREARQAVGILPTNEGADPADVRLLRAQISPVTIGPGELLGPRGD